MTLYLQMSCYASIVSKWINVLRLTKTCQREPPKYYNCLIEFGKQLIYLIDFVKHYSDPIGHVITQ